MFYTRYYLIFRNPTHPNTTVSLSRILGEKQIQLPPSRVTMGRNGKHYSLQSEYTKAYTTSILTTEQLSTVIDNLFVVFKRADEDVNLLSRKVIPQDFHEAESSQIIHSFTAYIESHPKQKTLSILDKYSNRRYTSIYSLHHDIRAVCSLEIKEFRIGSDEYNNIDLFYKFTTDLILREASRYHFALQKGRSTPVATEIQSQVQEDFMKIYNSVSPNGEVFTHMLPEPETEPNSELNTPNGYPSLYNLFLPQPQAKAKKQPLFSSLTGKSEIDPRYTIVPDPYGLAKTIPINTAAASNTTTLESLSPPVSKIPPPNTLPTDIISNYFHSIWYTTPIPRWLSYKTKILKPAVESSLLKGKHNDDLRLVSRTDDSYASFAPVVDTSDSAVTLDLKNSVWLSHIGRKEIEEYKALYYRTKDSQTKTNGTTETKPVEKEEHAREPVNDVGEVEKHETSIETDQKKNLEIDVANLVQWAPGNLAELESIKQEKEAIKRSSRDFANVITSTLLRLNKLRQERYYQSSNNSIIPPTQTEVRLYNKATKLIILFIEVYNVNASDLAIQFSKKLPVLVADYSGTLPGMLAIRAPAITGKSTRLPSIRGPYKKKNKLQ